MRVLIAVDGSSGSEISVSELRRAGMPPAVEALVLSVADVILPADAESVHQPEPGWLAAAMDHALADATDAVEQARAVALGAKRTIESAFPHWTVHAEACADSPAWGIVKKAEEWKAGLIVVGSHNRSTLGRLMLGSVSQTVLLYAPASVRISRGSEHPEDWPIRLVAGEDGSPDAEAALSALAARAWPAGATLSLVTVIEPAIAMTARLSGEGTWPKQVNQRSLDKLSAAGLTVSPLVAEGDPRRVLLAEAERVGADCIFIGARGLRGIKRLLLGSVSTAIAARAHCSVEVVRPAVTPSGA